MIVVDTNIRVYLFAPSENAQLDERLFEHDSDWRVPYLWRSEFRNAIAQYLRKEMISPNGDLNVITQAEKFFAGKEYMIDSREVVDCLVKSSCSAYDCEFVALAKRLDVLLITMDKKVVEQFPLVAKNLKDFVS